MISGASCTMLCSPSNHQPASRPASARAAAGMDRPDEEGGYSMPLPGKILKPEDAGRKVGLVYSDDALSAGPAAHALVIGVAAYQSPKYGKVLHTAAISARTVADWFVDAAKARFANPACGLGSLAVLLSETAGVSQAAFVRRTDSPPSLRDPE